MSSLWPRVLDWAERRHRRAVTRRLHPPAAYHPEWWEPKPPKPSRLAKERK